MSPGLWERALLVQLSHLNFHFLVHNQSSQFNCSIIVWCNKVCSQIEALKPPKRPEISFFTSPVGTKNATFERSTINLRSFVVTSLIDATHFIFKLKPWSLQNVPKHSFLQAQWPQETQLLNGPQSIFAILLFHHSLMQHNLFSNWSPEAPKTLQNTLFYKHSGHKKHNFWTVHTQSSQFNCSIIDWSNTIYSQIEALKTSKRPEAFLFTSPMDTRNTTFERSTLNLRNLIVPSWIDATQLYSLIEVLKSTKRPKAFFFTSPVDTNNASFERSRVTLRNDFLTKWWEISSFCQINDFGEMFFWRSWWRHKLMRKKSHWLIR